MIYFLSGALLSAFGIYQYTVFLELRETRNKLEMLRNCSNINIDAMQRAADRLQSELCILETKLNSLGTDHEGLVQ